MREKEPISKVKLWDGSDAWIVTRMEEFRELMTSHHFSADPNTAGFPFISPSRAAQSRSYQTFITMDPPDHGTFRRMLTKEFMAKRMQAMRPQVQAVLDRLLDDMECDGALADFIEKVALPLPSLMISIMLGFPGKLSHQDAVQMGVLLYLGHQTTANLIGLGLVSLLQHPEQKEALIANPLWVRGAAEDMLRFHSITHMNSNRVATKDVEIGGHLIRKHVVFETIFRRFPTLQLAVPFEELDFKRNVFVFGLNSLPVTW